MATPTYKADGTKATTAAKLDAHVFEVVPENHDLLKTAYTAYLSNGRTRNAVTKTRGLVRGGGKKPWKQKGTGRARFGSSRNPIWRGGGIAFGPTGEENYIKNMNVKAKRLAIRQALSLAHEAGNVIVIDDFTAQRGKTSAAVALLAKVGASRRILVVVDILTDDMVRATNNIGDVKLISAKYINTFDALNADTIVITKPALSIVSEWLGDTTKKEATS
ncbi:MAG TPA: 50S ribosomal protein L4 [Candidatus Saccharimonadales bacterium]|jgi:large subunit ribosomal protein L4